MLDIVYIIRLIGQICCFYDKQIFVIKMSIFLPWGGAFMPDSFVVVMGMVTVFIGLICIVLLCKILGAICSIAEKKQGDEETAPVTAPAAAGVQPAAENRQEIIAAVSAALAEEMGTDVSAIRIISFKKI